jgi:hypothetical protein
MEISYKYAKTDVTQPDKRVKSAEIGAVLRANRGVFSAAKKFWSFQTLS